MGSNAAMREVYKSGGRNIMKAKKLKTICGCVLMMVTLCGTSAVAAVLEKPTANLSETFDVNPGWMSEITGLNKTKVSAGWTNSAMGANFKGWSIGSQVPSQSAWLVGATNSSDGRFSGDFSKIESVSFDVQVQNSAPLNFFFKSTTGVQWNRRISDLPANTASGEWVRVTIPLSVDPLTGDRIWYATWVIPGLTPDFSTDIASVERFGFEVQRNDSATYASDSMVLVDNVRLIGPWDNQANWVGGIIPLAWLLDNKLTEADVYGDSDGDRFSNVAEFLTGTDPRDSNSFFRIEIGRNEQGKTVVKWNDNKYVQFDLFESFDLSAGFTPAVTGIMGMGTAKREMQVDDAVSGPHFFKVEVRPAQ